MVESNSVSNHMSKLTKSDDREEGVWFDYHLYDCWQNWMTQSPVTNWLKLVFDDAFLWKKKKTDNSAKSVSAGRVHVLSDLYML